MSSINAAIAGIPEKKPGEEAATEGQRTHLRSFGMFSESTIRELGVWQASYLIGKAADIRAAENHAADLADTGSGAKTRYGFLLVLLLIAGSLVWAAKHFSVYPFEAKPGDEASQIRIEPHGESGNVKPSATGNQQRAEPAPETGETPANKSRALKSLEGLDFPLPLVVVKPFELLNKLGKETTIAADTVITVVKRTEKGTLTMEINGETFVGNESRLSGKVERRDQ